MENNKKTLILSIVGILVLVIAVVGVSFAMYSFTGTGTKTNVIQTGTVSMSFDPDNNFAVSNQYPMSDAKGIASEANKAEFGVTASWGTATMAVKYDLGITNITPGSTLTAEYIKVALLDGEENVIIGTENEGELTGGVKLSTLASTAGPNGLISTYGLTGGTITTSGATDSYTILAYVSDDYNLPTSDTSEESRHSLTSTSETFSFKVGITAAQA